jgi:hypothetical protein
LGDNGYLDIFGFVIAPILLLVPFLIAATLGALQARRRGGRRLDMLQYGAVYAIITALILMFLNIIVRRIM